MISPTPCGPAASAAPRILLENFPGNKKFLKIFPDLLNQILKSLGLRNLGLTILFADAGKSLRTTDLRSMHVDEEDKLFDIPKIYRVVGYIWIPLFL